MGKHKKRQKSPSEILFHRTRTSLDHLRSEIYSQFNGPRSGKNFQFVSATSRRRPHIIHRSENLSHIWLFCHHHHMLQVWSWERQDRFNGFLVSFGWSTDLLFLCTNPPPLMQCKESGAKIQIQQIYQINCLMCLWPWAPLLAEEVAASCPQLYFLPANRILALRIVAI